MRLERDAALALTQAVRRIAREVIVPRFRALEAEQIETKSGPDDLVTVADREAEARIAEAASRILPGAAIVGEEAVAGDPAILERIGDAPTCVIVDPVDGTMNFARGLATFGVIVAVTRHAETVWGLLYDPLGDDWVEAHLGGGAWHCRDGAPPRKLGPLAAPDLERAELYASLSLYPPEGRAAVARLMARARRAGGLRCSCHEYRQMAFGHGDLNLSWRPKPWDHAAGVLVARECGALALMDDGSDYAPSRPGGHLVVGAGEARLRAVLAALD